MSLLLTLRSSTPRGADLTPSHDTPAITFGPMPAGTLTSALIPSGSGWLREKRVGVAETAGGVSQSSTADLDLTGSTRFKYPGVPAAAGSPSNPGQYVGTNFKPGGGSQSASWLFNVEFETSSPRVAFRINTVTANPNFGMIYVNGKRISNRTTAITATAGAGMEVVLTFPDSRARNIRVVSVNVTQGRWGGVGVDSGYTVTKPTYTVTRRIAIIGDSYVNGATGTTNSETFVWRLAESMGADEIIQAGIGGTGFTTTINAEANSNFAGRIADVMAMNPHVVIFAGGRNDPAAGLQTAVESALDAVGSGVERYIIPTASESGQSAVRAALSAAAASRGVPYVDVAIDSLAKIADNVHPTYDAHQLLAADAYAKMAPTTVNYSGSVSLGGSGTLTGSSDTIKWAGREWYKRDSGGVAQEPGPNRWSSSLATIDAQGALTLQIAQVNGQWASSELISAFSGLGYGSYVFNFEADVQGFGALPVFGLFTYEDNSAVSGNREIDLEYTAFGNASERSKAQYTVQPTSAERTGKHVMPAGIGPYTGEMIWQAGQFYARTIDSQGTVLGEHTIVNNVPTPGNEKVHLNFWLNGGVTPADGIARSVKIAGFTFTPNTTYTIPPAANFSLTFDSDRCLDYTSTGGSTTGGELVINTTTAYPSVRTGNVMDLRGSSAIIDVTERAAVGAGTTESIWRLTSDATNFVQMSVTNTAMLLRTRIAGVDSDVYVGDPSARYWRIAESGGTVTWSTSNDRVTWTTQRTATPAFGSLLGRLRSEWLTGYYGTEATPGRFRVAALNPASATSFSGASNFSGAGTLASTGVPKPVGSSTLSGAGTQTSSGVATPVSSATFSGSGTLDDTGTPKPVSSASLSGSGTLTQTGSPKPVGSSTLSGSGTLTQTGSPKPVGTSTLSGSGTLTNASSVQVSGNSGLSGSGTLTQTGVSSSTGTSNYTGSGTLSNSGSFSVAGTSTFSGSGDLIFAGASNSSTPIAFSGSGTQTASGSPKPVGTSTLSGSGTQISAGTVQFAGSSTYSGSGTLSLASSAGSSGNSTLSGSGAQTVSGSASVTRPLGLSGSGTLDDSGTIAVTGSVPLSGSGSLIQASTPRPESAVAYSGSGALSGTFSITSSGASNLSGSGTLSLSTSSGSSGAASLSGFGNLGNVGTPTPRSTSSLSGAGTLTTSSAVTAAGSSGLSGSGTQTSSGRIAVTRAASLSGSGTQTSTSQVTARGSLSTSGQGTLDLSGQGTAAATFFSTGEGTLDVSSTVSARGSFGASGSGTNALQGRPSFSRSTTFSGAGTLSTTGTGSSTATLALSGSGTLGSVSTFTAKGTTNLSGSGTTTFVSNLGYSGALALAGSGTLSASGSLNRSAPLNLSGQGTLAGLVVAAYSGALSLSGSGLTTTLLTSQTFSQTLALTSTGTTALTVQVFVTQAIDLSGDGSLGISSRTGMDAGPDQTDVSAFALVTLKSNDGTWTQISGEPTVKLSREGEFLAPAVREATTLVFEVSDGVSTDTVSIEINMHPWWALVNGYEIPVKVVAV